MRSLLFRIDHLIEKRRVVFDLLFDFYLFVSCNLGFTQTMEQDSLTL